MALAYALTTVSRLKTFAGITTSSDDVVMDYIIDSVTDYIETFCDRRFKLTAYTNELYTGHNSSVLLLKNFPISSSAGFTLQKRDSAQNESNFSTIESEDYYIDYPTGLITLAGGKFNNIPFNYRISYSGGFDFDNVTTFLSTVGAADLEWATWKLSFTAYLQRRKAGNIQQEDIGDYSVVYTSELMLDKELQAVLKCYKRMYG